MRLELKAVFMVFLVVLFPVYVSASSIDVTRYSGEDNINGYFRNYDKWMFEIIANLDGDSSITADQVKIQDVNAQNCVSGASGFTCTYSSDYYTIPDGSYPVSIKLLDDTGMDVVSEDVEMTVDRLGPVVDFEAIGQKGQNVSILFTIKDRGYLEDDFTKCSGIDKIEYYDENSLLRTSNVDSSQCTYSGSEVFTNINSDRIIIKAYDRMGYMASQASPEIEFDFNVPVINPATFKIMKNGADMGTYLSSMPDVVDFSIEVSEDKGLIASNVYADFSPLGGSAKVSANSCTHEDEVFTCVWNNVQAGVTSFSIPITAEDNVGNSASATVSKTVSVDGIDPEVLFIGTDRIYNDNSYISTTANIMIKVSETGSGISNVLMDLGGLNPAYGVEQADECLESGGVYSCYWYNKTTTLSHNGRGTLYLIGLKDNAGNSASGPNQGSVIVDKEAPSVGDVSLEAVSELGVTDILKSHDDLTVYASASDPGGLQAIGDFTNIRGSDYNSLTAICENIDGSFTCRWDIPSVFSGYVKTFVDLTFIDTAGNSASAAVPVEIYALEQEENPDYWSHGAVSRMPNALDRQTTPIINQKTYFHIPLISSTNAVPLSIELGECSGTNIDFIESYDIMNNQLGSVDPYVIFTLKTTDAKIDSIDANCSLMITSLFNNQVSNTEYETVPLTVEFYNMPLGEASDSLDKKIDDLKEEWLGSWFWDLISVLQIANDVAVIFCQGYNIFRNVVSVFQAITTAWGSIEPWTALSPAGPAVAATRLKLCYGTEETRDAVNAAAEGFFEKMCAFANCKLGPMPQGQEIKDLEYWGNLLGGGGGLDFFFGGTRGLAGTAADFEVPLVFGTKWWQKYTGKDPFGPSGFMNVKDSLVLSTLSLCVPGIVYNLEKMRQINCMYIDCLESTAESGIPASACDQAKGYLECKYIFGEVFQFFPLFPFLDYYFNIIKNAVSNPLSIAGIGISVFGCKELCLVNEPTHSACLIVKIIADIGDAVANTIGIIQLAENDWALREDYCENIEYDESDQGSGEAESGESGGIFG